MRLSIMLKSSYYKRKNIMVRKKKTELKKEKKKKNPYYHSFHENFTPDIWKNAKKELDELNKTKR